MRTAFRFRQVVRGDEFIVLKFCGSLILFRSVERFYRLLWESDFQSEAALKYKTRFEKNRERLFTFREFDEVPWNNNNAEHALADLRNVIGGPSFAKGIHEYLVLLSVAKRVNTRELIS